MNPTLTEENIEEYASFNIRKHGFTPHFSQNTPQEARCLIKSLLVYDPLKRTKAKDALNLPYFDEIRNNIKENSSNKSSISSEYKRRLAHSVSPRRDKGLKSPRLAPRSSHSLNRQSMDENVIQANESA